MKFLLMLFLSVFSLKAISSTPTCHEHSGGNYCKYTGLVEKVYVNSGNLILMYFENPIDSSIPSSFGLDTVYHGAGAVSINDNNEFAQYFYSTVLAAQASGRKVTIQMRGTRSGYLKIDRVWLAKP